MRSFVYDDAVNATAAIRFSFVRSDASLQRCVNVEKSTVQLKPFCIRGKKPPAECYKNFRLPLLYVSTGSSLCINDEVETKQKIIFYIKREYNRTTTNTNTNSILTVCNHHQSIVSSITVTI